MKRVWFSFAETLFRYGLTDRRKNKLPLHAVHEIQFRRCLCILGSLRISVII
jgi:hypothetical protein